MKTKDYFKKLVLVTIIQGFLIQVAHAEVASSEEVNAAEEAKAREEDTPKMTYAEPFAFADFTWLNGNSGQTTSVLDSKYFTWFDFKAHPKSLHLFYALTY